MTTGRERPEQLRIALAHDYFLVSGGAERVAASLHQLYPSAPMFTSAFRPRGIPPDLDQHLLRPTYLQHAPAIDRLYRAYLPFYRRAFASIDLLGYDLVLASSSAWAHRLALNTSAPVVVYCHNPPRFLWQTDAYLRHERGLNRLLGRATRRAFASLRESDLESARRVASYIANSETVAKRIRAVYGRDAEVIAPPIETGRFTPLPQEDFALVVSRLQPYKRIDLAVAACRAAGIPLRVVGDGAARPALERLAGDDATFYGRIPDTAVADLMGRAKLLIVAGEEDFGLTALEANAAGCPVVAFGAGGALETVMPGETGILFPEATSESLTSALLQASAIDWDRDHLTAHAATFDVSQFHQRIADVCRRAISAQ